MKKFSSDSKSSSAIGIILRALLFCAWFALYFWLCLKHEPFRDEAQSWMIAKHNTLRGIMDFSWEEGHPWLWHLILKPFAALGLPYGSVKFIGFGITALATGIYVMKSPLPLSVTALTIFLEFSYYSSFARCYCILWLMCVLTALSWKTRLTRPWFTSFCIGLLASTHIMAWPLAAVLACVHLSEIIKDKERRTVGLVSSVLFVIPVCVFCLPLKKQFDITLAKFGINPIAAAVIAVLGFFAALLVLIAIPLLLKNHPAAPESAEAGLCYLLPVFIGICTLIVLNKATKSTIAAETNLLHICEIVPVVISAVWISSQRISELRPGTDDTPLSAVRKTAAALAIVTVFCWGTNLSGLHEKILSDTQRYYSGSQPMAQYIKENVPQDALIIATRRGTNTAVAAWLDGTHTLTCLLSHKPLYYTEWCTDWPTIDKNDWLNDLNSLVSEYGSVYVIYSDDTEVREFGKWIWAQTYQKKAEYLYHSDEYGEETVGKDDYKPVEQCERYWLFRIDSIS